MCSLAAVILVTVPVCFPKDSLFTLIHHATSQIKKIYNQKIIILIK